MNLIVNFDKVTKIEELMYHAEEWDFLGVGASSSESSELPFALLHGYMQQFYFNHRQQNIVGEEKRI